MIVRYLTRASSVLVVIVIVGGCASQVHLGPPPEPRPLGKDFPSFEAPVAATPERPRSDAFQEPGGKLSLNDALALALMKNPELAVFSWEVRAREAEALQAGLRPNPELLFELENFSGSGGLGGLERSERTVTLFQLVETAGRRGKRSDVARLGRDVATWEYEAKRIDVLSGLTKAFATTRDAYRSGRMRFTDVLDTQRTLFELRGRDFSALARYHSAVADIERLIGEPLSGLTEQKER